MLRRLWKDSWAWATVPGAQPATLEVGSGPAQAWGQWRQISLWGPLIVFLSWPWVLVAWLIFKEVAYIQATASGRSPTVNQKNKNSDSARGNQERQKSPKFAIAFLLICMRADLLTRTSGKGLWIGSDCSSTHPAALRCPQNPTHSFLSTPVFPPSCLLVATYTIQLSTEI